MISQERKENIKKTFENIFEQAKTVEQAREIFFVFHYPAIIEEMNQKQEALDRINILTIRNEEIKNAYDKLLNQIEKVKS